MTTQATQLTAVQWTLRQEDDGRWSAQRQGAPPLPFDSPTEAGAYSAVIRFCKDNERGKWIRISVHKLDSEEPGEIWLDFTELRHEG